MFIGMNAIDFSKRFNSNESCYEYLMEKKWGKGTIVPDVVARTQKRGGHLTIFDAKNVVMMKV